MRLTPSTACLSTALFLSLLACQPAEQNPQPSITNSPDASRSSSYLFTANPGIRTTRQLDISGTVTGTIDGQSIAFGPDKPFPVQAIQGYNLYNRDPSYLGINADNETYQITLAFNGPFEAGRNYRIYNPYDDNGQDRFAGYTVQAFIRTGANLFTREIIDLTKPDKQVRITAISDDYIDIQFDFTLKKAGATPERLTMRIKNVLNENRNLLTQSAGDPYWSYANVERWIEGAGYQPIPGGGPNVNGYPNPPTARLIQIDQRQLTTSGSDVTYEGQTSPAVSQWISRSQLTIPRAQTRVEYGSSADADTKRVSILWPDFRGVGKYTGDQVQVKLLYGQGATDSWYVTTTQTGSSPAQWQVDVQRVTPDVIEGTFMLTDFPVYKQTGSTTTTKVNAQGRFKVIYPR